MRQYSPAKLTPVNTRVSYALDGACTSNKFGALSFRQIRRTLLSTKSAHSPFNKLGAPSFQQTGRTLLSTSSAHPSLHSDGGELYFPVVSFRFASSTKRHFARIKRLGEQKKMVGCSFTPLPRRGLHPSPNTLGPHARTGSAGSSLRCLLGCSVDRFVLRWSLI